MLTLSRWLTVVSKLTHLKPNSASLPSQLPQPACSRTRRLLPSCGSGSKPWRPPWRGTRHSQTCSTSRGLHPHDVEALVACHLLVRVTTVSPGLLQGPPHSCPCPLPCGQFSAQPHGARSAALPRPPAPQPSQARAVAPLPAPRHSYLSTRGTLPTPPGASHLHAIPSSGSPCRRLRHPV